MRRFKRTLRSLGRAELVFAAQAFALAPLVEASLATLGLDRTLRLARLASTRPAGRQDAPTIERSRWLVDAAYRVHFVRGACLPRAIVQYALVRRWGTPARFVLGVRKSRPPEAHAWVEVRDEGRPADAAAFHPLLVSS